MDLTLTMGAPGVTASNERRMIHGVVVKFGRYGMTSAGRLKVAPGALTFPEDLTNVKLTKEHDRGNSRGHLRTVTETPTELRASLKVSDGPEGDDALREAVDHTRDGLSFDVVDAVIDGDTITSARVIAVGQVGIPAYDDGRITDVAAALSTKGNGMTLTTEQTARLAELRAATTLNDTETAELNALLVLSGEAPAEPAPAETPAPEAAASVAASLSAVPKGVPGPSGVAPATTSPVKGKALSDFYKQITAGLKARTEGNATQGLATITAALSDITQSAHQGIIEPPAWSGELWSGLVYEPQLLDLFNSGDLTSWEGTGWRFTNKLEIKDYAGDKAAIPTDTIGTEDSGYEAARMAVGVDIDRKFFDFPNEGFVQSLFEQVRESWTIKLDAKVAAYIAAHDVAALDNETSGTGVALGAFDNLLKAAAAAVRALKRRRVGNASFILVNDEDLFTLLDMTDADIPAFLELFGIEPRNFRAVSEDLVPAGTVLAGVKQAATVRTLPGSPIRVEAQNLVNGGVDEAFFGYWAIEEHHTSGIASTTFTP